MRPIHFAAWALAIACGGSGDGELFDPGSGGSGGVAGGGGSPSAGGGSGAGATGGSSGSAGGTVDASAGSGGQSGAGGAPPDASAGNAGTAGTGGSGGGAGSGGQAGRGGSPGAGSIACLGVHCSIPSQVCCLGFPISGCIPSFPSTCATGVQVNCDDSNDCASGTVCCARRDLLSGGIFAVQCLLSCDDGQSAVLCTSKASCEPGQECADLDGLDGYRACES